MMDGWMVGWLNDRWRNRRETETEEFLTDALMCGLLIVCSVFSRLLNLDSSALERFSHKSSSPPATAPFMLLIVFSRISDTSLFRNYYHFMCMGILLHFYVLGFLLLLYKTLHPILLLQVHCRNLKFGFSVFRCGAYIKRFTFTKILVWHSSGLLLGPFPLTVLTHVLSSLCVPTYLWLCVGN